MIERARTKLEACDENNDDIWRPSAGYRAAADAAAAVARRQSCVDNDVSRAVVDSGLMDAKSCLKSSSTAVCCLFAAASRRAVSYTHLTLPTNREV